MEKRDKPLQLEKQGEVYIAGFRVEDYVFSYTDEEVCMCRQEEASKVTVE